MIPLYLEILEGKKPPLNIEFCRCLKEKSHLYDCYFLLRRNFICNDINFTERETFKDSIQK